MRKLDKTKKSNIKCEHCKYATERSVAGFGEPNYMCKLKSNLVNYWNRCKDFEWHEKYEG